MILWEKNKPNKIVNGKIIDEHFNILDIIGKEYDELAYSNLFSYIFKTYPDVFCDFNKVLGVKISAPYTVVREKLILIFD